MLDDPLRSPLDPFKIRIIRGAYILRNVAAQSWDEGAGDTIAASTVWLVKDGPPANPYRAT